MNPGNVLAFNPLDEDGQHLNNRYRAGEFALYDEYDPLRKILLTPTGELYQEIQAETSKALTTSSSFSISTRPKAWCEKQARCPRQPASRRKNTPRSTMTAATPYSATSATTGSSAAPAPTTSTAAGAMTSSTPTITRIQTTVLTISPDTHPFYQDRAYGGAGRDVLIGNTGGDRLIDWVGEYNSYLVPYAPFGQASVSRTLQPFLPEFLYALSAGDGADFTRSGDTGADSLRNGEPEAELGLVLQKDTAWQDQTGAPADPQAGNIPGGARDVLRSAGFNDGTQDGFYVDSGIWTVVSGRYQVAPTALGGDAVSVFYVDEYIPSYFEMLATVRAVKPTGGYNANAYLIFDYQSPDNFKYAGVNVSTSKLVMGYRDATGWHDVVQTPYTTSLSAGADYNLFLSLNGNVAILKVNNKITLTYTFAARVDDYGMQHFLNEGMVGIGAKNSKAQIDNVVVQRLAPQATLVKNVEFTGEAADSEVLNWLFPAPPVQWMTADGRYIVSPGEGAIASNLVNMRVAPASVLGMTAKFSTAGEGGFVFDYYSPEDFKFVVISADSAQLQVGHYTSRTGWVVDAQKSLDTLTGDITLGISVADSSVSVTLDGSAALSHVYNSLLTDGAFGLLARSGEVSFDSFTIMTDDPAYSTPAVPKISISDATVKEGDNGTQAVTLTFTLSEAADFGVSVEYTTVAGTASAGTDYQSAMGTLTFAAGETSKQVTFYVLGDTLVESDETFSIELSNAVGATIADGTGTVTVTDNDTVVVPGISISDASITEGNRTNKTKVTVTVTLSQASTSPVTVQLATQDGSAVSGSDYVAFSGPLTFAAGEISKQATLTVNGDRTAEADETFKVILSSPVGATIVNESATVTIINDDGTALKAAETPAMADSPAALTSEDLDAIIAEAVGRWSAVIPYAGTVLNDVSFRIADYTGLTLGITGHNVILIDSDAAGYGWFVDSTPSDDMEFGQTQSAAAGRIDLLTVVMHEMGHVLGFKDTAASDTLMSDELPAGVRYSPAGLAASPTPASPLSTFLQFRPPSNGIPAGWVFEDGTVSRSSDYEGWWPRLRSWVTGSKPAHDALPAVLLMRGLASSGSMEDGASGIGKDISVIVNADHGNAGADLGQGQSWASDFVLNAGKKANPNAGIRIEV